MSERRTSRSARLSIGGVIALIIALFFIGDLPRAGLAGILILAVPYLAFMFPFQCREETQRRTACIRSRWGWFFGCHDHQWRRMRRIFSTASGGRVAARPPVLGNGSGGMRPVRARPTSAARSAAIPAAGEHSWYDRVMLVATVISCAAGVVAAIP